MVSVINILSVLIVEGLNFWLLLTLTDTISIVQNFVSLAFIAEFDDLFISMYDHTRFKVYFAAELDIDRFRNPKIVLSLD